MLLSRSSQYTLQALAYLAQQPRNRLIKVKAIAEALALPEHYLGKLVQPLVRIGWLTSARGRHGGVKLVIDATHLTLLDILQLTEGANITRECLLGFSVCEDETACVMHCQWQPIKQELDQGLGAHTLAALASDALPAWLR